MVLEFLPEESMFLSAKLWVKLCLKVRESGLVLESMCKLESHLERLVFLWMWPMVYRLVKRWWENKQWT